MTSRLRHFRGLAQAAVRLGVLLPSIVGLMSLPAIAQQPPGRFPYTQDPDTGAVTFIFPVAIPTLSCGGGTSAIGTDANGFLFCEAITGSALAITQLNGDVQAGPGHGNVSASLAASGVTAGTYTKPTITVDAKGRITAAANGTGCDAGVAAGAVLFSDGTTCASDVTRFFWDTTLHQLDLAGGDNSGWDLLLRQGTGVSGVLKLGVNPLSNYGQLQALDTTNTATKLALNGAGGVVTVGTVVAPLVGAPVSTDGAIFNSAIVGHDVFSFGFANAYFGGLQVYSDGVNEQTKFDLYNAGPTLRVHLSTDPAVMSFVPNRFSGVGLSDSTLISCNGVNNAIQTDISGNLACGSITGGGGGVVASGGLTAHALTVGIGGSAIKTIAALTNGQIAIGSTGNDPVPASLGCSGGISCTSGAGTISISGAGAGGGNGLFQPITSAVPTCGGIPWTTWLNQGSAACNNSATGAALNGPSGTVSNNVHMLYGAAPTAPYSFQILLGANTTQSSNTCEIGWTDGTKIESYGIVNAAGSTVVARQQWTNATTFSASTTYYNASLGPVPYIWLGIGFDGSNYHVALSADGTHFADVFNAGAQGFLANYNNIGFNTNNPSNAGTAATTCTLMSFQQNAGNLPR